MLRKLKLFSRFPRLRWEKWRRAEILKDGQPQLIKSDVRGQYPSLAEDFEVLDKQLMPYFWELDEETLAAQNRFRLAQVTLIGGAALATTLGAIQAAKPNWNWIGFAEAVLAAALVAVIMKTRTLKTHENYFTNRLKAEMLRGEYFLFLGRAAPYNNDADRVSNLVRRVGEIKVKEINDEPAK
jgi:hypothetical protein